MRNFYKKIIKKAFNALALDIIRINKNPYNSILKTTQTCESLYPFTKSQQSIKVKKSTLDNIVQKYAITLITGILILNSLREEVEKLL